MAKSVFPLEKNMVSLQRETFYLIDRKSRKLLATVQGQSDSVTIPIPLLSKTKDNITIHNHPRYENDGEIHGGWGFSPGDLEVAVSNNVFQSRVVGWDYSREGPCVYVITRNGISWKVDLHWAFQTLSNKIDKFTALVGRKYDAVSATFLVYHEWVDEISMGNFYYDVLHF